MFDTHRVEMDLGGRTLSIETGRIARQAGGAVIVQHGDTTVLGTATTSSPRPGINFFPLTVDYREKTPAAGKFPGGFRKREGAPNTKEILTMRNIDRPIRPLFPKGYMDEVQIQCWVLSADGQNEPDVLAAIAASAALSLSEAPFQGPIGNVRIGRVDGDYVVMPTVAQMEFSDMDLLLAGHGPGVDMIEIGAHELDEDEVADAIEFGYEQAMKITELIQDLQSKAGKDAEWTPDEPDADLVALVNDLAGPLREAKTLDGDKLERQAAVKETIKNFIDENFPEPGEDASYHDVERHKKRVSAAKDLIHDLEEDVTKEVIRSGQRTDGRAFDEIRDLDCVAGLLPRVHGSSLFTRGETQALVTVTLGTGKDEQIVDGLRDEYVEKFYLHYNFPPFSVGECKRITGPGRREIGHGKLAEKALLPVLPPVEEFPYTVRVVSDIMESNGSSSMASARGGTLALMDAGVPISAPVAGISVGMIAGDDENDDIFLTDIQGEEDHFGDMDFKVTGTRNGVTAIQLDLKILGLSMDQIRKTLQVARDARLKIIDKIEEEIPEPRPETSEHAPRLLVTSIPQDKIGALIGPGGKNIRGIEEKTGAKLEIEEDGTVIISAVGKEKAERALEEVEKISAEVKLGQIYTGTVNTIKDFGAFVEVIPGRDGLLHISELADGFVENVTDIVKRGDEVRVKVINIDDQGRVKLSRKQALEEEGGDDGDAEGEEATAEESSAS
ncbi:MAG: polyribonucleotide nucleotidyltransferase [Phycisphaeraceae bacterium]|nr:polyribonucleotide nucleotidyltransferase [Phycisphaeraceae bacterium]